MTKYEEGYLEEGEETPEEREERLLAEADFEREVLIERELEE